MVGHFIAPAMTTKRAIVFVTTVWAVHISCIGWWWKMEKVYTEIIEFVRDNQGVVGFFLLIMVGMFAMLYLALVNTPYYGVGI